MSSHCRTCDQKPPAKKWWVMGSSPPLSTVGDRPLGLSRLVTLHKLPKDSTDSQKVMANQALPA